MGRRARPAGASREEEVAALPTLDGAACRGALAEAASATLATVSAAGTIDLVPIVFALDGADRLVSAVDHKPKRTLELARLANVEANPAVTLLVDHYDDDWARLWWVRVRGVASVLRTGAARERAIDALVARYDQYRLVRPAGAAILVDVTELTGWAAAERT